MSDTKPRRKVTFKTLQKKMAAGEPITQLAAYDYRTAVVADRLGMDILCVSDTGGMILFGHQSTTSVSFDEVMMMSKAIDRGSQYGLRMVDMPYWSFHVSKEQAVENAGRFVHEANAEVMKCEGNRHHVPAIEAIVNAGIPVQGHIGITPMRMPQLGGFVAQGKTADRAKELIDDAKAMYDAGCFSILCEVTTRLKLLSILQKFFRFRLLVSVLEIAQMVSTSFPLIYSIFGKSMCRSIQEFTQI